MQHFTRGTRIDFSVTFYDANGDPAVPVSAALTLAYPRSGGNYPVDGTDLAEVEIPMALNVDGQTWEAVWDSAVARPGIVFWAAVSADPALTVEEGRFRLKGNPATLKATD